MAETEEESNEEEPSELENPDEPCNNCGESDWIKFEERKPSHLPEDSDVVKHYFSCKNCRSDGFIFETGGNLQYTANLRK